MVQIAPTNWRHLVTGLAFGTVSFGIMIFVDYAFLTMLVTTLQTRLLCLPLLPIVPGIACGIFLGMLRRPWLAVATALLTFVLLSLGTRLAALPTAVVDGTMLLLIGREVLVFSVAGAISYWAVLRMSRGVVSRTR